MTPLLQDTYAKIRRNEYHLPSKMSTPAQMLIRRLLAAEPSQRPTVHEILDFDFFTSGYMPTRLPTSCLSVAPQFKYATYGGSTTSLAPMSTTTGQPLAEINRMPPTATDGVLSPKDVVRRDMMAAPLRTLNPVPENKAYSQPQPPLGGTANTAAAANRVTVVTSGPNGQDIIVPLEQPQRIDECPNDFYLEDLLRQLTEVMHTAPEKLDRPVEEDALDPAAMPVFWISKWVDYSDKYGLGYQLCDNSVGVLFNDLTKIVLDGKGNQVQYIERDNRESYYTIHAFPTELHKKITLLKYFQTYMNEHLLKVRPFAFPQRSLVAGRREHERARGRPAGASALSAHVVPHALGHRHASEQRHDADQFLPGPHENHHLPADAGCDVHRRRARLQDVHVQEDQRARLLEGSLVSRSAPFTIQSITAPACATRARWSNACWRRRPRPDPIRSRRPGRTRRDMAAT